MIMIFIRKEIVGKVVFWFYANIIVLFQIRTHYVRKSYIQIFVRLVFIFLLKSSICTFFNHPVFTLKLLKCNNSTYSNIKVYQDPSVKMSFWLIIIDIGHASKVLYYDTYLGPFNPFFSK